MHGSLDSKLLHATRREDYLEHDFWQDHLKKNKDLNNEGTERHIWNYERADLRLGRKKTKTIWELMREHGYSGHFLVFEEVGLESKMQVVGGDFRYWWARWTVEPWLVWLSGFGLVLQTERSLVWFPVRAHAWIVGQITVGDVWEATKWCFSPSLPPFYSL